MSFRSEITIDWTVSPRIIEVDNTLTEITCQDLWDTIATLQAKILNMPYRRIGVSFGKFNLGGGVLSNVFIALSNAKVKFADRAGPTVVPCFIKEGTIIAFDDAFSATPSNIDVIEPSDYVFATVMNEVGGTITDVSTFAASVWEKVIENGKKAEEMLRIMYAVAKGKTTIVDGPPVHVKFRDDADTKDRVDATMVDSERTNVVVDGS
jgi:hypothetical protein